MFDLKNNTGIRTMLRAGIVGLPNVGKSTLFNALTAQASALAANYPFATIEPNVGVVPVPDERLEPLAKIVKTTTIVPATVEIEVADKLLAVLSDGKPARTADLDDAERAVARGFFLLTSKPTIYAANVDEATLADPEANPHVRAVHEIAAAEAAEYVPICAQLEAELVALAPEDRKGYLAELGVESCGVDRLIQSAYRLLGLMSFLTAGEKEVRAWTVPRGTRAPQAAGTIHTDIERGFIRAEIVSYADLVRVGSNAAAREQGLLRLEGKDYVMQEGDVVHFRFNV